jgi:hypothetical protein
MLDTIRLWVHAYEMSVFVAFGLFASTCLGAAMWWDARRARQRTIAIDRWQSKARREDLVRREEVSRWTDRIQW